jgi:hypothetical protein
MIGFLIAVVVGLVNAASAAGLINISLEMTGAMAGIMALIGLVVGLVNVSDKEAISFLIGAIAVTVAAGAMAALGGVGVGVAGVAQVTNFVAVFISELAKMIVAFVGPAALVVGLKVVYSSAREA